MMIRNTRSDTTDMLISTMYETNVQHTLLTDYVDMSTHPTYVILDSGCTRAMGSRFAIDRLVRACQSHPYSHTSRAGQAGGGSFKEKNYKSKTEFAYRMCTG